MNSLDALKKTTEALTDKAGQKIDAGIFDLVLGLRAHDIPTQFSCSGHDDRMSSYPYVDIYADDEAIDFDDYSEANIQKKSDWIKANGLVLHQLIPLLSEFYKNRETPYEHQLIPQCSVDLVRIRLKPINADTFQNLDAKTHKAQLKIAQDEMKAFGLFLQEKYTEDSIHS